MEKILYPEGLKLKMLKSAEKLSSIAGAINIYFLHIFYSFLLLSKF